MDGEGWMKECIGRWMGWWVCLVGG